MKKTVIALITTGILMATATGCEESTAYATVADQSAQKEVSAQLTSAQPTPTDINYSLERYNLIKRAYWVNGQTEKANALICPVQKPLGYITLIDHGVVFGNYVVDGKVSSLNSYLTPDSEYYEASAESTRTFPANNNWLADVDGSYGENDAGIFFFTVDGDYQEWTGTYHYSSTPIVMDTPASK